MSRNASGTYTLPSGNPVVSGTLIEASWANTTLSDLATAMTDSLSRSGQGGMTAALRLYDGTSSVPGLAWGSETTTGWYRAGAGDMRLVVTGSEVMKYLSTGITVTGTLGVSGNATVGGTLAITGALTLTANPILSAGTANGVAYLNGSKVVTSGSALTFDGTQLFANSNTTTASGFFQINDGTTTQANTFGTIVRNANDGNGRYSLSAWRAQNASGLTQYSYIGTQSITGASNYTPEMVFGLSTGASTYAEQMRLTSTGLGIGTSSPAYKLEVSANGGQIAATSTGTNPAYLVARNTNVSGQFYFGIDNSAGNNFSTGTAYGRAIWSSGAYPIVFSTNSGSNTMTFDSSGNLGLGVTPSAWSQGKAFEISAVGEGIWGNGLGDVWMLNGAYYNSGFKYSGTTKATAYRQGAGVTDGSHSWHIAASGTAGNPITFTQAMTLDASGNLGIGTTAALSGYKLHVAGGVYQDQTANGTSGTPVVSGGYVCGPSDTTIYAGLRFLNSYLSNNASQVAFYVTNTTGSAYEAGRFNPSGALLINRTTQVNSERFAITGNTSSQCMALVSPITGAYDMCNIINGNGQVGLIQTNGTSTSYGTSSDYRLKENVQPMIGALNKVALLKPCTYKWKADGSNGEGFIAHELAEVVPDAVTGEKDAVNEDGSIKPQGIDTSFLVATLTAAIQEQQAIIEQLKARLDAANL